MKYKTLCRLLVKLMGLYFTAMGFCYGASLVSSILEQIFRETFRENGLPLLAHLVLAVGSYFIVGLFLLFNSKWVADRLVPSNRPYCHECGYDLTGAIGDVCPECGTAFRTATVESESHH